MRKALLLAGALASAGCEIYAVPGAAACSGTTVASFSFAGVQAPGTTTTCAFAGPTGQATTNISFTGTVTFDADGGSGACLSEDVPQALLNLGTHSGDAIDVGSVDTGAALNGCTCPVPVVLSIAQEITGDILLGDGGTPAAFDGGMTTTVSAEYADGGSAGSLCCGPLSADGGCSCGLPCTIDYSMTATAVVPP
jgi:hypothetical protein